MEASESGEKLIIRIKDHQLSLNKFKRFNQKGTKLSAKIFKVRKFS